MNIQYRVTIITITLVLWEHRQNLRSHKDKASSLKQILDIYCPWDILYVSEAAIYKPQLSTQILPGHTASVNTYWPVADTWLSSCQAQLWTVIRLPYILVDNYVWDVFWSQKITERLVLKIIIWLPTSLPNVLSQR